MEKTLERFSCLANLAIKRLRRGKHEFNIYPSYIEEGVVHRVVSLDAKGDTLELFFQADDPCGWDSLCIPVGIYIKNIEGHVADPERNSEILAALRSEIHILLTFHKEWFEKRLDALNEESARQRSQCDPYWEVFANGVDVDIPKRVVSFEYTVMNDKFWDDVPFDTLKAENGLDLDEYAHICEELREEGHPSIEEVISSLENRPPKEGSFMLGGRKVTRFDPSYARIVAITRWSLHRDGNTHPSGRDILLHRVTDAGQNILYVKFCKPNTGAFGKEQTIYRIELITE